jgi:ABC-type transporter Mla MlaB component
VRDCWQYARETTQDQKIRVELAHIYIFDAAGKALLSEMHRAGVEIVAQRVLTKAIRDEIVAPAARSRAKTGQ